MKVPTAPPLTPLPAPVPHLCNDDSSYLWNHDSRFDASCSTHASTARRNVSWEWDFDYDGKTFDVDAVGVTAVKLGGYAAGQHRIGLRVTDDEPTRPQVAVGEFWIVAKPPPNCPHPSPGGDSMRRYAGVANVPLAFDASRSWDPNGDPLTYKWRFEKQLGDAVGKKVSWTFKTPGTYAVSVEVTDVPTGNASPYGAAPCSKQGYAEVRIKPAPTAPSGLKPTSAP